MAERRPNTPGVGARAAGRRGGRRAAERHYVAVVAAEARRLARQLRPADNGGPPTATPMPDEAPAEAMP